MTSKRARELRAPGMTRAQTGIRGYAVALACGTAGVGAQFALGSPTELAAQATVAGVRVERLLTAPIITPDLHPSIGENIQGPSVIRVPEWVENPLGAYYLYFADHKGTYIRLAYADDLLGPWHVHPPGSLQIGDSYFATEPPEVAPDREARLRAQPTNQGHAAVRLGCHPALTARQCFAIARWLTRRRAA